MTRALLVLALLALPAAAQESSPKAPEPAKEKRPLNLRLDNPASFATVNPDQVPPKDLPALGGDARKVEQPKREGTGPTPGGPYPKDTNPNR